MLEIRTENNTFLYYCVLAILTLRTKNIKGLSSPQNKYAGHVNVQSDAILDQPWFEPYSSWKKKEC